jgi:hypothetical protein
MERKLVYRDSDGIRRTAIVDDETPDKLVVNTELNLGRLLENNAALEEAQRGRGDKLVARAPLTVYERSIHEGWDDNDWKRWLNDPDNRAFRVWKGRV